MFLEKLIIVLTMGPYYTPRFNYRRTPYSNVYTSQYYSKPPPAPQSIAFEEKFKLPNSQITFDITERKQTPLILIRNFEGKHFISMKELELEDFFSNKKEIRRLFSKCRLAIQKAQNSSEGYSIEQPKIKELAKSNKHRLLEEEENKRKELEKRLSPVSSEDEDNE